MSDEGTAAAFAHSWNDVASVYSRAQFDGRVDPVSTYIVFRNGSAWKFGGTRA